MSKIVTLRQHRAKDNAEFMLDWDLCTNKAESYSREKPGIRWEAIITLAGDKLTVVVPKGIPDPEYQKQYSSLFPCTFEGSMYTLSNGGVGFKGIERNQSGYTSETIFTVVSGSLFG
jgi:hypothetical protein